MVDQTNRVLAVVVGVRIVDFLAIAACSQRIEVGIGEIKRQMRAIRYQLEVNLGQALSDHDPVLVFIL